MSNNMNPPGGNYPMGATGSGYPAQTPYPQATSIFVVGLLSLLCCGPLGIAAIIMGNKARADIAQNPGRYSSTGLVTAGWVMGIVALVFWAIGMFFFILSGGAAVLGV